MVQVAREGFFCYCFLVLGWSGCMRLGLPRSLVLLDDGWAKQPEYIQ